MGVKNEGSGGVPVDDAQALKLFVLCMIAGGMSIIGGFSLGDTADELIGWFDEYADDTQNEGSEKRSPFSRDMDGTSAIYDVIYHSFTLAWGFIVFSNIVVGGFIFAFIFMWFEDPTDCDFNAIE